VAGNQKGIAMKSGYVYYIRNAINGNWYVGSTVNKKRLAAHKRQLKKNEHDNCHLQSAWNKYGESAFTFNIEMTFETEEGARDHEQTILNEHFGKKHCYNVSKTVQRNHTKNYSGTVRERLSEATKKSMEDPTYRKRISDSVKKKYKEDPTYRKRIVSDKQKEAARRNLLGKPMKKSTKKKLSEINSKKFKNDPKIRKQTIEAAHMSKQPHIKKKISNWWVQLKADPIRYKLHLEKMRIGKERARNKKNQ
jgi:group I intron endonuclease